jgi:hypothetical protein
VTAARSTHLVLTGALLLTTLAAPLPADAQGAGKLVLPELAAELVRQRDIDAVLGTMHPDVI